MLLESKELTESETMRYFANHIIKKNKDYDGGAKYKLNESDLTEIFD